MVHLIPSMDQWQRTNWPPIKPPPYKKQPGRPKKSRNKGPADVEVLAAIPPNPLHPFYNPPPTRLRRIYVKIRCSICGQEGHNKTRHANLGTSQAVPNQPNQGSVASSTVQGAAQAHPNQPNPTRGRGRGRGTTTGRGRGNGRGEMPTGRGNVGNGTTEMPNNFLSSEHFQQLASCHGKGSPKAATIHVNSACLSTKTKLCFQQYKACHGKYYSFFCFFHNFVYFNN
ncbi:unnamed protein product [Prunus brigantina]